MGIINSYLLVLYSISRGLVKTTTEIYHWKGMLLCEVCYYVRYVNIIKNENL